MVTHNQNDSLQDSDAIVDKAVAEGGAYDIIRQRLLDQGAELNTKTQALNDARLEEFGSSDMEVAARVRVRTENNCIARDIVQVGEHLLFGYNVFIGLKKETKIEDVFSLFKIKEDEGGYEMLPVSPDSTFLSDSRFVNDFDELYRYYKNTRLIQLSIMHGKLLAGFQIGEKLEDIRVFRWSISADAKKIEYIDNRGERDIQLPPPYDFEWIETTREDIVHGRHAHINVLDTVFVETLAGDLTVKVENNTEDGLGIYREKVEDKTQSLDDADVFYARVGKLILIKVLPYRETQWRYLIFNTLTQTVVRIDAIGESCVQLPEDHGIIFPGGYYLENGEHKKFNEEHRGLQFKRQIRSPNGEDVLYVFYEPEGGAVGLFAYNLIEKKLQNPIYGNGYALFENGRIVIFSAEDEPTRVHPMQIWNTPYLSAEYASQAPSSQTFFGRIGNAVLVRGVSDLYSICRMINNQSVSSALYEELSKVTRRAFDDHYWITEKEVGNIDNTLRAITDTAELVIDEFEKVESIRKQSAKTMAEAEREQQELLVSVRPDNWEKAEKYVNALGQIRRQRGHLTTIKERRYIDQSRITQLDQELVDVEQQLSSQTVEFLMDEQALLPYLSKIDELNHKINGVTTIAALSPLLDEIETTASGLDLLSELMSTLKIDDATVRTRIIDTISEVYSKLNQSKAQAKHKEKGLGSKEAIAQFGAQFKLFSQTITNALGLSITPEKCDEQLARLLIQLEELESQFSDHDEFLSDIMAKREEIYQSFESHKQQLVDERQRKAQAVSDAADRVLKSIEKRSLKFSDADDLNTYFASDALVAKTRELAERLRELDSAVKADDIDARFKAIKEQALRSLRDKTDIYEDDGNVIKLGPRHKFSVNTQELDLTILPRSGHLTVHLTGTNFYESIGNPELDSLKDYWDLSLESETEDLYRSEFLAASILDAAEKQAFDLSMEKLRLAINDEKEINQIVKTFAVPRYKEGYEKGVHDHDAVLLLAELIPTIERAELLRYDPLSRGLAQIFWANINSKKNIIEYSLSHETWSERALSAFQMRSAFASDNAIQLLVEEINEAINQFIEKHPIDVSTLDIRRAADYLAAELGRERVEFIGSKYATELVAEFKRSLNDSDWRQYQKSLEKLMGWPAERWNLSKAWLEALVKNKKLPMLAHYIPEAIGLINADERLSRRFVEADLEITVNGLLGDHTRIKDQSLHFSVDGFLQRVEHHKYDVIPAYHRYLDIRQDVIQKERDTLRLEEFKPKPLSSFVRNRLINEAYLPIIGDNLAKQMGTIGENKRTDLMGLLMMISPPGYGKTTLMEYVASRLGLIFMKINCPSLGHDVLSLDPEQAPNATARQELIKLNLGLEMGNNVMLYLDDIQHTHPEFLQKFISLCDGTRRIEGVWRGKTKTYDMRGRKFCVVMAGNPYTESGEAFKVPDMLANRADIYNLGDILGGMDEQFALSYIENSLTSNPILAPLALRDLDDLYKLVRMCKGENIPTTDLSYQYSGAEINEIKEVLSKLFTIQDVVLKINQQYIASAAQNDKYRVEPPFKLQGSYRNMNKMAEKVSAVMNQDEMMEMIADHYLGESQLLTTGAEDNLLKLAELRGNMTPEQSQRWQQIKQDFLRNKSMGGDDADTGSKVVVQLNDIVDSLKNLSSVTSENGQSLLSVVDVLEKENDTPQFVQNEAPATMPESAQMANSLMELLERIDQTLSDKEHGSAIDESLIKLAEEIRVIAKPLIKKMDKKLAVDLRTYYRITELSKKVVEIKKNNAAVKNPVADEKAKTKAKITKKVNLKSKTTKGNSSKGEK